MLTKKIVFYTSDIYLDLIPAGEHLPVEVGINFPVESSAKFRFGVGQLAEKPTDIDFNAIGEVNVEDFPAVDEPVEMRVFVHVSREKVLSMGVAFGPEGEPDYQFGDMLEFERYFVE